MITAELARELKEKGYPQEGTLDKFIGGETSVFDRAYAPTTDDLLEQLGDEFYSLKRELKTHSDTSRGRGGYAGQMVTEETIWYASSANHIYIKHGNSPVEALTRLWIALEGAK